MSTQKRNKLYAGTAIAFCFGLVAACDQQIASAPAAADPTVNTEPSEEGVNSEIVSDIEDATSAVVGTINAELTGTTQGFIDAISLNTMYELAAAEIALERSHNPAVLDFANALMDESNQTQDALNEAVLTSSVPVRAIEELDSRHQGMLDNLAGASDEDFEARFLEQQVNAHDEALNLTAGYAEDGRSPPVREFAADTAPMLEQRLARAEALSERIASAGEG